MYDLAFNKYHCVLKLQAETILGIFCWMLESELSILANYKSLSRYRDLFANYVMQKTNPPTLSKIFQKKEKFCVWTVTLIPP